MPVAPTLPISSLSTRRHTDVRLTVFTSRNALSEVKAQTLSSCPYERIMDLSNPISRAFPAGTILSIFSLTASFSLPLTGVLPIRISRFSPSTTLFPFLSICSLARWIRRSVTQNTGSLSSSPILTSTVVPSVFTITP